MGTQTVEFRAAPGLTLTAKLFTAGSDTVVQTASAVTEATNRKGTYAATFTDPGAAEFELIALSGATPVARWFCTLTLTTATFQAYEVRTAAVVGAVGSVTAAVTVGTNNDKSGYSLTPTTGLGNQTANITGSVSSVTARVTANTDQWGGVAVTGMPMPTYTQPTGFLAATFPATVSSYAGGAVASVTGSVGSIAGVTFPTHFNDLEITANGHVSAVVQSIANNSITASSIQGGAITAAKFAADAITASALAADAVNEIQSGLATLNNQTTINNNVLSRLASSAYTAPDNSGIAAIKVVTDRVNTGLVQDNAVWQFTVNMLENAPSGAGGGSATLQNQELILDQLNLIQDKTDLITSSGAVTSLLAGAVLEPGTIQGFPTTLKIGDSYTAANGRAIDIPIVDTDGIPLDAAGSLDFSAATVTFTVSRAKETNASRIINGTATVIDPPGTGTANAPYVRVEISSSETAKGLLGYRYTATLKFTWSGTGTDVMSFESSSDIVFDN
jgi:hypothetical protein